jgi:HK97 family phage portal protein
MGLLDFFKKKPESRASNAQNPYTGYNILGDSVSITKDSELMSIATALRCMTVVADTVATLSGSVYKNHNGISKTMPDHMMKELWFNKPNGHYSAYMMKRQLILNYQNLGNGYIVGTRDNRGRIVRWDLVKSLKVVIHEDEKYYYNSLNDMIYDSDDVIHLVNVGHNPYVGVSKIQNYALLFGKSKASLEYVNKMYANNMFLGGVLQYPESIKMTYDKAVEVGNLASTRYGGLEKSGGLFIVDQGGVLKQYDNSMPLSDAEYVMSERLTNEDICRIYGVPPFMTFDYAKMSGESMEAAKITFVENTILPIVTQLEQELKNKAFKNESNTFIKHEIKSLLRADIKSQAEYWSKMAGIGVYTINEIRAYNDDPPVEGGDITLIQANNYYPLNKLEDFAQAMIDEKRRNVEDKKTDVT